MLFYIVTRLWFSSNKDDVLKKTQRRLLLSLVFSVSVLIAIGGIFSGFEYELKKFANQTHKEIILYDNSDNLNSIKLWLKDQADVYDINMYSKNIVTVNCGKQHSLAMLVADPQYKHKKVLITPLLKQILHDCSESITITSYNTSAILPLPKSVTLGFSVSAYLSDSLPLVVASLDTVKQLSLSVGDAEWLSVKVPRNKNILLWLRSANWHNTQIMDMSVWSDNFSKAIFSQKILMWIIMGLMLLSSMFQLKHILEDMLNRQSKFWSLLLLHGVSLMWIRKLFFIYIYGFIFFTMIIAIPLGILLAYAIDPLINYLEYAFHITILDPEFFITDHIPLCFLYKDIIIIELVVFSMSLLFIYFGLKDRKKLDIMKVLKNA